MNSLSALNSNGLGYHGRASAASSEVMVNSYESLEAGLTIQTREGDLVTLSTSSFSEFNAYGYDGQAEISNGRGQLTASTSIREITLSSGETFSFSVQGDLSEEELEDIEAIVAGVDSIIGEMAEGDMEDAVLKALSMGMETYDSVAMYSADISVERSYSAYAETRSAAHERGLARGHMPAPEAEETPEVPRAQEPGNAFMDQVTELLEAQKEEALARAQQPLSKLFEHHINALDKEDDAEGDEAVSEDNSLSKTLEAAANQIDLMINEMVKNIFKDTLNRFA